MITKELSYYTNGIEAKNTVILSQSITLVESSKKEHQVLAQQIINHCLPFLEILYE